VRSATAGRWAAGLTALFIGAAQAQTADRLRICAGCHGADGVSQAAGVPSLAGQPRIFLENYLVLTREGIAGTDVMRALLKGVSDKEISALAVYYSKLPLKYSERPTESKIFERGNQIAAKNRCGSCHLPDYRGREQMPRLAGQREEYLYEAMRAYQQNRRPGGDTIMAASLYGIADADLKALAHYLSRLK
jgi:cytochrome c553